MRKSVCRSQSFSLSFVTFVAVASVKRAQSFAFSSAAVPLKPRALLLKGGFRQFVSTTPSMSSSPKSEQATERPGSSQLNKLYPQEGAFECVGCGAPLYTAKSKFDSGCGWPAFYEGIPGAIKEEADADGRRIEILCNNCGSHLGHVFKGEGFPTPTNERHCVNGICLNYVPANAGQANPASAK